MKSFYLIALLLPILGCKVDKTERMNMMPKVEEVKAYCVGRYYVEMPSSYALSKVTTGTFRRAGPGAQEPAFEVVVRALGLTRAGFAAEIRKRSEELKKKGHGNSDLLRLERAVSDDATLFRVQRIDDAYVSELDFLRGENLVTARLKSYEGQFLSAEERLVNFAAEVKEKAADDRSVGTEGFCLGPIVINGKFNDENGRVLFRDGKGNDFGIDISTYKSAGGTPLLARMSGPTSLLSVFDVRHTTLRSGERTVAGMPAQEWLGWTKLGEQQDVKTFGFALETLAPSPGKKSSGMKLSFDSAQPLEDGSPTRNSMSDDEAVQFWDTVVKSIRPVAN